MNVLFCLFVLQITPSRGGDKDVVPEDGSASKTLNRSSSFLFESLCDGSLLAGLSPHPVFDQSEEEEPNDQEIGRKSPTGATDRRRRSELLANQEAEQQEAVCWGESSFSLSEWGDSLLVGGHFLQRQGLLRCAERSVKEHSGRQDKGQRVCGGQQTSESKSKRIVVQPEHTGANTSPALLKRPPVQVSPNSTLYCSPGLQEIFERWPSISDQPCPHAAPSPPANAAQVLDLPQASVEATRKRLCGHEAPFERDPHEEQPAGHEPEDATERPGSANDLIPPTQERAPVTPRLKLTTSSVQSPVAAPPLQQPTPSTLLQPKPAVPKGENLSKEQADAGHDHQELNSFPLPNPASSANPKRPNDQSARLNWDWAPPSSPRQELPSDVESPLADEEFTLQLSQDASLCSSGSFAIIDVASDRRLFETFINEWKTKERYSLALAWERREPRQQPDGGIGWKPKNGNSNILK